MESMSVGTGIAVAAGLFSIIAVINRLFPPKHVSQFMCNRVHDELNRRITQKEEETDRRIGQQEKTAEKERRDILDYLRRIEDKLDDHISCHAGGKQGGG